YSRGLLMAVRSGSPAFPPARFSRPRLPMANGLLLNQSGEVRLLTTVVEPSWKWRVARNVAVPLPLFSRMLSASNVPGVLSVRVPAVAVVPLLPVWLLRYRELLLRPPPEPLS